MASLNKVQIIGNLGDDPETRFAASGTAITEISVATTEKWTDKQSGEKQEKTEWHRITFFGRQAEVVGEYMKKGRPIYVEGRLQTDKYEKDGVTRYSTKIIASDFQMLGSNDRDGDRQQGDSNHLPRPAGNGGQKRQAPPPADSGYADDQIPF
ncbi:single-stranded DNA-binding protein [Paraburkholderia sp.]|uniref:single-stranded DNA-binding protein n=1 Tax=Paraburkholderia sp. TaxID=1926495 RepID=UPI002D44B852|nr:single-stranded DNA-binding protein [Paraburkholderia sp.]HZZ05644.1 single-stranded DNA-binding protein [Paraburkholderia sp.]